MTILTTPCNRRKVSALICFSVLVWMLGLSGCGTVVGSGAVEKYNQNPLTVTIPANLSPQVVEHLMVLTLKNRKWTVVQQSPQEVVGQLNHRRFQAKTILKVDSNIIQILNDSSYKAADSAEPEPGIPKGWLKNLQKDLSKRLTQQAVKK